jgi:tRNA pseudouridine55 synthase
MNKPCLAGLLLLNKKSGVTSFEALFPVKRALGSGKAGHTGTLDKFASGLLLILTGSALKLAPWFSSCDKEYEGTIRFGIETDTLDPEGVVIGEGEIPSRETLEKNLSQFTGEILQAPPAYSALHVDGKRAHELARSGKTPEMKKRPVTIYSLELLFWEPPFAGIRVRCSSGTYIRSLARDLGQACGSRAHLTALCRTSVAGFSLKETVGFQGAFETALEEKTGEDHSALLEAIKPISPEIFEKLGLPYIFADETGETRLIHGKPLTFLENRLGEGPAVGVFSAGTGNGAKNRLVAVLEKENSRWKYGHVFCFQTTPIT